MKARTFTTAHRHLVNALQADLAKRIQRHVTLEYGQTDDGNTRDVALCVEELPYGSCGTPGPLVTILTSRDIDGGGFAVMAADGASLLHGVTVEHAIQAARFAAARVYRKMTVGAMRSPAAPPAKRIRNQRAA